MTKLHIEFTNQFIARLSIEFSERRVVDIVENYSKTIRKAYDAGLSGSEAAERIMILRDNRLCINQPDLLAA